MNFISYAQNFEDVMLWRAFKEVQNGFYIDIGAQDPIVDSVSKAFYENGWRGIHVEAISQYVEKLKKDRPDEQVFEYVICDKDIEEIEFYEIPDTGISTGDPIIASTHEKNGFKVNKIKLPCISLSSLFNAIEDKQVHWLKIDVEGMEKNVLNSWGNHPIRPQIIVIESTVPLTQIDTSDDWKHLLIERDYKEVYFDGLNRFYIYKDYLELSKFFKVPPNIFDNFYLAGTANSTLCYLLNKKNSELEKKLLNNK